MTLSSMVYEYLVKDNVEKDRDPHRLFFTDIGKCPRQVAYRLVGATKDPETAQEIINKTIMFDLAQRLASNLAEALDYNGLLIEEEGDVAVTDRENWGGRFDIIADYNGRRVIEVKSVYPGAFKKDLDSFAPAHHHQAMAYHHYCEGEYELESRPLIAYWDRGGQNTPQEVPSNVTWNSTALLMDELDMMRDLVPDLPPKLDKVIVLKDYGKTLSREADPLCRSPYCKYTETCHQDYSTSCMANRERIKGQWQPWVLKKAVRGHEKQVEAFTTELARKEMKG